MKVISSEEINRYIAILSQLNTDIKYLIFPKNRTALIKAAGRFSRPDRDELSVERETEKWLPNVKWKSEIEQPEGNRNRHARGSVSWRQNFGF
jgi:hypothetical protein